MTGNVRDVLDDIIASMYSENDRVAYKWTDSEEYGGAILMMWIGEEGNPGHWVAVLPSDAGRKLWTIIQAEDGD